MAEDSPFLQVDNDWKKQAQEEKRKLAEKAAQQKAQAEAAAAAAAKPATPPGGSGDADGASAEGGATFGALVQQMMTQALFYLGELAYPGRPPMLDLDRARNQHDLLTMLEQKTANNLTEEEQKMLDTVLHEVRTRFIRTASEYATF